MELKAELDVWNIEQSNILRYQRHDVSGRTQRPNAGYRYVPLWRMPSPPRHQAPDEPLVVAKRTWDCHGTEATCSRRRYLLSLALLRHCAYHRRHIAGHQPSQRFHLCRRWRYGRAGNGTPPEHPTLPQSLTRPTHAAGPVDVSNTRIGCWTSAGGRGLGKGTFFVISYMVIHLRSPVARLLA